MTLAADIAADYSIIDGIESVTLTPQNPAATAVTGVKAQRRALTRAEISGQVVGVEPQDVPFHLWFGPSSVPATVPKNGDTITDSASVVWTIQSLTYSAQCSRWRAACRRQVS